MSGNASSMSGAASSVSSYSALILGDGSGSSTPPSGSGGGDNLPGLVSDATLETAQIVVNVGILPVLVLLALSDTGFSLFHFSSRSISRMLSLVNPPLGEYWLDLGISGNLYTSAVRDTDLVVGFSEVFNLRAVIQLRPAGDDLGDKACVLRSGQRVCPTLRKVSVSYIQDIVLDSGQAQIEEHHGHVYELLFKAIDDNNDGHITKAEFDAHASDLDVDGNGEVTEQEFTQVWGSVTQHPGYMNIHAAELLFESVDGGTGAISLSNIDVLYAAFDTDGQHSR
ncbi:hypothetical protein BaRGS_00020058 [Batillaria attramentaria]|uniref:EF-hand domain-containing protein n=1 Tax=Batillaria attramentaria TaxID=370345 RepID=A0ABD0KNQ7_9CAEN